MPFYLQLSVYLVCFDLSLAVEEQKEQILYWLNYLHSLVPDPDATFSAHRCHVLLVGLKNDIKKGNLNISGAFWQKEWPKLEIHDSIFCTTSKGRNDRMEKLLSGIKTECLNIMKNYCCNIPTSYQVLSDDLSKQNKLVLSRRYLQQFFAYLFCCVFSAYFI